MNVAVLVACLYICNCLLGFNATGSYRLDELVHVQHGLTGQQQQYAACRMLASCAVFQCMQQMRDFQASIGLLTT